MSDSYTYHVPDRDTLYYLLISQGNLVLMVDGTLPVFHPQEHHFGVVGHINDYVAETFGLKTIVKRCIHHDYDVHMHAVVAFYHLVAVEDGNPFRGDWIIPPELPSLAGIPKVMIREAFTEVATRELPAQRVPWTENGWFGDISAWMTRACERLVYVPEGIIRQSRAWTRSSILQLNTAKGRVYLKAVSEAFSHEPLLTQQLAKWYPENTPTVIAIDADKGWLLMEELRGTSLDTVADVDTWEAAVRKFGKLQFSLTSRSETLRELGVSERPPHDLMNAMQALVNDQAALCPNPQAALSEDSVELLHYMIPAVGDMAKALAEYQIPLSLEHGDLWPSNIMVGAEDFIFFDWSDSSVSHPFFSMAFLLSELVHYLPLKHRPRLLDAYLENWSTLNSMANLRKAFQLAEQLAPLHYAVQYHQTFLPRFAEDARWEMANMIPYHLRKVLQD